MEKTNEATAWRIEEYPIAGISFMIMEGKGLVCALHGEDMRQYAELIVKAVNAYDSLVAENTRQGDMIVELSKILLKSSEREKLEILAAENQKLREALILVEKDAGLTTNATLNKIHALLTKAKNVYGKRN